MMKIFQYFLTFVLAIAPMFVSAQWTGPSSTPPNGNVPPPLNAGAGAQSKLGPLEVVASFSTQGDVVIQGAFTVGNWPGQATDNWLHVTNGNLTSPQYKDLAFGQAWIAGLLQNVGGINTQGALTVQQNSTFQGPAVFSQTSLFQGALTADALATFNQAAVFEQQATFKANAEVQGNLTVAGDVTSRGQLTCLADGTNCPSSTVPNLQGVTAQGNTTTNDIQAPRLVDNDNATYYVDPAGITSALFAGNVGIGATTPGFPLDIQGNASVINLQNTGSHSELRFGDSSTRFLIRNNFNTNQLDIAANTNPTASPGVSIGAFGNVGLNGASITNDDIGVHVRAPFDNGFPTSHYPLLVQNYDQNSDFLSVRNDGRVGVGTSNPGAQLHVDGGNLRVQSSSSPTITIADASGLPSTFHHEVNGGQYSIKADGAATGFITASNAHAPCGLDFQGTGARFFGANCDVQVDNGLRVANSAATNAGTIRWTGSDFEGFNGTTWQSFTGQGTSQLWQLQGNDISNINAGNVGIGNANPPYLLSVERAESDVRIQISNTNPNGRRWNLISSGDGSLNPAGSFGIQDENAATTRFLIDANGNVGIGTGAPNEGRLTIRDSSGGVNALNVQDTSPGEWAGIVNGADHGLYASGNLNGLMGYSNGYGVYGQSTNPNSVGVTAYNSGSGRYTHLAYGQWGVAAYGDTYVRDNTYTDWGGATIRTFQIMGGGQYVCNPESSVLYACQNLWGTQNCPSAYNYGNVWSVGCGQGARCSYGSPVVQSAQYVWLGNTYWGGWHGGQTYAYSYVCIK